MLFHPCLRRIGPLCNDRVWTGEDAAEGTVQGLDHVGAVVLDGNLGAGDVGAAVGGEGCIAGKEGREGDCGEDGAEGQEGQESEESGEEVSELHIAFARFGMAWSNLRPGYCSALIWGSRSVCVMKRGGDLSRFVVGLRSWD